MEKTAASEIAKELGKIANKPKAERLLLTIPVGCIELPPGEYILDSFLRVVAAALEGKL